MSWSDKTNWKYINTLHVGPGQKPCLFSCHSPSHLPFAHLTHLPSPLLFPSHLTIALLISLYGHTLPQSPHTPFLPHPILSKPIVLHPFSHPISSYSILSLCFTLSPLTLSYLFPHLIPSNPNLLYFLLLLTLSHHFNSFPTLPQLTPSHFTFS